MNYCRCWLKLIVNAALAHHFLFLIHRQTSDIRDGVHILESIKPADKPVTFQIPANLYNKAKLYEISEQGLRSLIQRALCESSCFCWLNEVKYKESIDIIRAQRSSLTVYAVHQCQCRTISYSIEFN